MMNTTLMVDVRTVFKEGYKGIISEGGLVGILDAKGLELVKMCSYKKPKNCTTKRNVFHLDKVSKLIFKSRLSYDKKSELLFFLRKNLTGLPDCIVLNKEKEIGFLEIKNDKDKLRKNQIASQEKLKRMGYTCITQWIKARLIDTPQRQFYGNNLGYHLLVEDKNKTSKARIFVVFGKQRKA